MADATPAAASSLWPLPTRQPSWFRRRLGFPSYLAPLIGRERDVATLADLLQNPASRLLTLIGPGGVGKTRLAVAATTACADVFPDGAVFVPLAAINEPSIVLSAIARALDVRESAQRPLLDVLITILGELHFLLVLDNFEHVLDAAVDVASLIAACPKLTVLVTSRAWLQLSTEQRFVTPPLALPETGAILGADTLDRYGAIALFVDRARRTRSDFALDAGNAATIAAICRHLDGLPLAIELAAVWMRVLSPEALLARLQPRLALLTGGAVDQPTRLQTMRDAIAWSYDRLTVDEQRLFRRLAVFVGGFTLEAAEWVGAQGTEEGNEQLVPPSSAFCPPSAVLNLVTALVDKSLLQPISGPHGQTRYAMLETVREFGVEALTLTGEKPGADDAHAGWCIAFAERAEPELAGPDSAAWVARIEAELGNIRAAHAWLRQRGDAKMALRLAGALGWFWSSGGNFHEGRNVFDQVLAMPGATEAPAALAKVLHSAGDVAQWLGNPDRAREHFEQALVIFKDLDDRRGVVAMLRGLGSVAIDRGDLDAAAARLREVQALAPDAGAAWEAASAANLLAVIAYTRGDYTAAMGYSEEAVAAWQELGDTGHVGTACATLARAALAGGYPTRAGAMTQAALAHMPAAGDDTLFCECFEIAARFAAMTGQPLRAARLLAASDAMRQRMGTPRWPAVQALFDQMVRDARQAVGESPFATAWVAGGALSLDEAIVEMHALADLMASPEIAGSPDAASLTAREREVLRLLALGASDKEIAAQLGLGRRTVSSHVTAIRAKLDAPSRTAAAAIAVRDHLI